MTHSAWAAWATLALVQIGSALLERVRFIQHSPLAVAAPWGWHRAVLHGQVLLQFSVFALALWCLQEQAMGWAEAIALGLAVGGTTGSQGITFAHELGHSRSRFDRMLGWLLMASVNYSHFMVEHYRGHHPRAATEADPASARRGESLWRFLPRTLVGSCHSAWALEGQRLVQFNKGWRQSSLLWAHVGQLAWLALLAATMGGIGVLFWLVQSAYAIFLLEAVNYIEHYGLQRRQVAGRREPFGVQHAWNADHFFTNCLLVNLQRHSDHHMHAWKPYATLQALAGPQLPTGYAGCLFLAIVPPLWFAAMEPRLESLQAARGLVDVSP